MKRKEKKLFRNIKLIISIILIILGYYNQGIIIHKADKIINVSNFLVKNNLNNNNQNSNNYYKYKKYKIKYNLEENLSKNIEVNFCPQDNCFNMLNNELLKAKKSINCAFYELNENNISNTLLSKSKNGLNISLIIDDKYLNKKPLLKLYNTSIKITSDLYRKSKYNNYMHNKFCVIDNNIIISGSTNPTTNGLYKNNNNMIKIKSKYLAKNYENEFHQLFSNIYSVDKISVLEYNNISLNFHNQSSNKTEKYIISSYFCPEDKCADKIINILDKAKSNIYFATFSFTNNDIEKKLIELQNKGIKINGVIEKRNANGVSSIIKDAPEIKIFMDKNKNNMHNKYFIIDKKYVITGSMNPSKNGDKYNDENIFIIENKDLAEKYYNNYLSLI